MKKRLLSLLLTLALLGCGAAALGEPSSALSAAQISGLQSLAGESGAAWSEGTPPSKGMNAFQMWQWTDWFLSNRVRSLLGAIQDYQRMESGALLNTQIEKDQWQLRGMESTLSRFEAQLEEDRLAILNGISLYQSDEVSEGDRLNAVNRILEAVAANVRDVERLDMARGKPVQLFKTVGYNQMDEPIEYSIARYRGDRNRFEVDLQVDTTPK